VTPVNDDISRHPAALSTPHGAKSTSDFDNRIRSARESKKRRDSILSITLGLLFLAGFLGLWYAVQATGLVKPLFISDPISVFAALIRLLGEASTWRNIGASFVAAILGLVIGSILGIGSGVFFARIPVLYRAIRPFLTIFNAFPRPAFAPIFILWFGLGATPKVAVAITIVYFVLVLNTMAGIHSLNADIRFLSRSLRMSRSQLFFLVELPHAAPTIVAGLRLGAVYSVLGVVVSEIVAANQGLGQLLVQFTNQFAIAESFAVLILMAALAIVLDFAVSIVQRRMTWAGTAGAEH
jgi:NitT/TauT family transport system permease protein